jgi:multisubunit Na+/H+ antiporter MnhC subunit
MRMYWLYLTVLWIVASGYYAYLDNDTYSIFFAAISIFSMGVYAIIKAIEGLGK